MLGDLNSGRAFDTGCQCVLQDGTSPTVPFTSPRCTCAVSDSVAVVVMYMYMYDVQCIMYMYVTVPMAVHVNIITFVLTVLHIQLFLINLCRYKHYTT